MKKATILVVFLFFSVPIFALADDNPQCVDSMKDWVFHFPQENERGRALTITSEALSNPDNIRRDADLASWFEGQKLSFLSTPQIVGKEVTRLTISRSRLSGAGCVDMETKSDFDPIQEMGVAGNLVGNDPITAAEKERDANRFVSKKRTSIARKALGIGLSVAPLAATVLGGAAAGMITGMAIPQGVGLLVHSGGKAEGNSFAENQAGSNSSAGGDPLVQTKTTRGFRILSSKIKM